MPRSRSRLLTLLAACAGLGLVTCTDQSDPAGPSDPGSPAVERPRYITPTGLVTSTAPEIFSGAGDIADCGNNNDEATAVLLDGLPGSFFTLGDNTYPSGTASEFANCYGPTWGRHKARTHPSVGNHDYDTPNATPYFDYFGASAGTPGQGYYSFDLGAWHVIVLNSNISMKETSPQVKWLQADLAAHSNRCVLSYFHHPIYSSDVGAGTGGVSRLSMRPLYAALYDAGAELVLTGHRHWYERIAPMTPDGTPDPTFGLRQLIVGSGGVGGANVTNIFPLSEVRDGRTFGVLKVYLYEDSYAWKFLPVAGQTFSDSGSAACHGPPGSGGPRVSPTLSTVTAAPAALTAGSGSSTITVTARDDQGNPFPGAAVTLAATGSGNTLTQPSAPTNASGVATGTLSATGAGTKIVSATIAGTGVVQTASITVAAAAPSASRSSVGASPAQIVAGTGSSTITVTVRDAFDNLVEGTAVTLAASGTGNTLTQPSAPTGPDGLATGTLRSTVPGAKTVTATAGGTPISQSAGVTVVSSGGAVITHTLLTAGNDPVNQKVYTTGPIAPAPNTLITLAVVGHRAAGATASPTVTGGGMSAWTEVASTTYDPEAGPLKRVTIFRAMSGSPGNGPITITWSSNVSNCQWIVSQWGGVDGGGANGAGAIVQTTSAHADQVGTLAATLAPLASAGNAVLGVVANTAAGLAVTPGPGFSELAEQSSGESPRSVLESEWSAGGNTTIAPTWAGSLSAAVLGVELRAASGP